MSQMNQYNQFPQVVVFHAFYHTNFSFTWDLDQFSSCYDDGVGSSVYGGSKSFAATDKVQQTQSFSSSSMLINKYSGCDFSMTLTTLSAGMVHQLSFQPHNHQSVTEVS